LVLHQAQRLAGRWVQDFYLDDDLDQRKALMKILILSDLHTEYQDFDPVFPDGLRIDAEADVVVLAGDIGSGTEGIEWAARTFPLKPIVYVAGNHEFYDSAMETMLEQMREVAGDLQVHFLERDSEKSRASDSWVRRSGPTLRFSVKRSARRASTSRSCA